MMGKFGLKYVCQQHISPIVYQYKLMVKMLSTFCTVVTMSSLLTPGLHFTLVYTPPTSCQAPAGAATSLLCWWPATAGCVQPSVSEHQLSVGTTGQCARARCWSDVSPVPALQSPGHRPASPPPPPTITPALGDTSVASVSAAAVWSQAVDIENAPKGNRRVTPKSLVLFMSTTFKTCCLHSHL